MFLELIFVFILTIFLLLIIIRGAEELKLLDYPKDRSSHNIPKPRGAGVAIFLSILISFILFKYTFFMQHIYFFISVFIVFFTGLYDDIKGVQPKIKFLGISFAILLLMLLQGLEVDSLGEWFGYEVTLPYIISILFTIFVVVGYTNALNLIDGLDGLAAGISFVIFLSFLYFGLKFHDSFIINISLFMLVSLVAFLIFNWYPSKIFLGDSGSLVIGFIISVLSLKLIKYISITSILFLASLPILDTVMVMVRRIQRGLSPFHPDKTHIHHKLFRWKCRVDFSVWIVIIAQIIFVLLGVLLAFQNNVINILIYLFIIYIFFVIFDDRKTPRGNIILSYTKSISDFLEKKYIPIFLLILLCGIMIYRIYV